VGVVAVTAATPPSATGAVRVTSEQPLSSEAVRDAVDEAGYELVG
jgi:hypothetical protein